MSMLVMLRFWCQMMPTMSMSIMPMAEANKANVAKGAIDTATKPIEANEANKSYASQDSNKKSTSNDENSDIDSKSNESVCGRDLINCYHPIFVSGDPQD
jgi:hypothetical protein